MIKLKDLLASSSQKGHISQHHPAQAFAPTVKENSDKFQCPKCKGKGCDHCDGKGYHIKENNTILIIGSIKELYISQTLLMDDGWVQLDNENIVTINGLDGYAVPKLIDRFPYARPKS